MITGAHTIIYSKNAAKDRKFFDKVINCTKVDIGGGWLIFGLPPAELGIHPTTGKTFHELYLMCDDIEDFIVEMKKHDIPCSKIQKQPWGLLTELTLPGGGKLGVYQARHKRPKPMVVKKKTKK